MRILHIDIETYSDISLKDCGVHVYSAHPSFNLLLVGWAFDNEPVTVIPGADLPFEADLLEALEDRDTVKVAHNAAFEMACLGRCGVKIHPNQWVCSMAMCAQLGFPPSLDQASQVMNLNELKYQEGRAFIRLFCSPVKGQRVFAKDRPGEWAKFVEYNRQDVVVEREIFRVLSPLYHRENKLWLVDYNINKRGVVIDKEMAEKASALANSAISKAREVLIRETGLDDPTDVKLRKQYGILSLRKKSASEIRKTRPELEQILNIRGQVKKTSTAKYETMLRCAGDDSRARGLMQYYGAARTGRWAGRLIQTQNLPRISMKNGALDTAREAVLKLTAEEFEMMYGDEQADVLSQLIRTALIPKPGHLFVVADFSSIEARVLAWLAGEKWRLEVFGGGGRIYESSAERMFGLEPGSVGKESPYRQRGKVAELALGYGGGVGALTAMGALDMGVEQSELGELVQRWRQANQKIVAFWHEIDSMLKQVLTGRSLTADHRTGIRVSKLEGVLQIGLLNGRKLTYQGAYWDGHETRYTGLNQVTHKWGVLDLYGAKAAENIVQAISRDCLAELLIWAEEEGLNPVFHVHDEIVCEVPENEAEEVLKEVLLKMKTAPYWALGLPIKGDGMIAGYYNK